MKRTPFALSFLLSMLFVQAAWAQVSVDILGIHLFMDAEQKPGSTKVSLTADSRIIGWPLKTIDSSNQAFRRDGDSIKIAETTFCIGVGAIEQNAQFRLQTCDNSDNQKFTFVRVHEGDTTRAIKMKSNENLCVDLKSAADGNPALVILWPCNYFANQRWSGVDR